VRFLRPTPAGDLVSETVVLRRGKRQVVMTVTIATATDPDTPVAHAVITCAPVLDGLAGIRNRSS
jgi:acyl-coenzyme A thioesterase PaaI-like protein